MKLLFDENLSNRLVKALADEYPGSAHIREVGLRGSHDTSVWNYARSQNRIIVSKDTDFRDRSVIEGPPPKVIWLDVGNAGTSEIASMLRADRPRVAEFAAQNDVSLLILSLGPAAI